MAIKGGRKPGAKGKDPVDAVQALAKKWSKKAIAELGAQMTSAPEKAVRVSAARELLDRAFGRPTQQINNKVTADISVVLKGTDTKL